MNSIILSRYGRCRFLHAKSVINLFSSLAILSLSLFSEAYSVNTTMSAANADLADVVDIVTVAEVGSDRQFLQQLMADTWASLDAMVDDSTGLPRDKNTPGGATNTTNIGLYLASLCVAQEVGLIEEREGEAKVERIIKSLESFQRVRGFMPNFIPVDLSDKTSHGTMAVSDFNKLAIGLIMSRQTWPTLAPRINQFLDVIDWGILYDANSGNTYWGLDLDSGQPVGAGRLWLAADTRLATFMMNCHRSSSG